MASGAVFGSACAAVPKDGPGSFDGMATDPVATAASHNPVLSTLVTAVGKAGLVDSLNSAQGITVFAPINDAFGATSEEKAWAERVVAALAGSGVAVVDGRMVDMPHLRLARRILGR